MTTSLVWREVNRPRQECELRHLWTATGNGRLYDVFQVRDRTPYPTETRYKLLVEPGVGFRVFDTAAAAKEAAERMHVVYTLRPPGGKS